MARQRTMTKSLVDISSLPTRRRDAEATRKAILDAAVASFGEAPFDQVGLRSVAFAAGVDAALIARYFGSKEGLFAAAVGDPARPAIRLPLDRSNFGEWLARRLLERRSEDPARLLMLQHSVKNATAAAIVRRMLLERFVRPVGAWIGGEEGELRASLIISHLAGFAMMLHLRIEPLASDSELAVALIAPMLQALVDLKVPLPQNKVTR